MDWQNIFGLTVSPLELFVRGTAMYLFLFLLFRIVVKRRVGSIGMADILVLVIIADAAQNGMAGEYKTLSEGFILVGTLIFWNKLIDWLVFQIPALRKILEPPPLLLIKDGRVLKRHLRRELMSEAELRSKLREQEVGDPSEVAMAHLEPDGELSVLKKRE